MGKKFIGRKKEEEILLKALVSDEAEMISVIGRRRVGKTFLIKSVYQNRINFEITGIQNAPKNEQLRNFANSLKAVAPLALLAKPPADWLEAFFLLINYLKQKEQAEKLVVFFDELPWLATHKSGFLRGLSYFWNSWAVNQHIVVVVCGSAASWMIQKVVNNTGGLYNRISRRIILKPFTLAETEEYLHTKNIKLNRYHITHLYMAMGGIPHYLKEVEQGKSAVQNIEDICFSDTGILKDEFQKLYPALFEHADKHIAVIRALAQKRYGMTRNDLIKATNLPNGNSVTKVLEELRQSGFIAAYLSFGKKKKNKLYRLTDEYSLFYLQFVEKYEDEGPEIWKGLSQTQVYKSWSGYAFESLCLKHIPQIKQALGISGVYATSSSFYQKGNEHLRGVQIDLLIDRNDQIINLFEIKFYNTFFNVTKDYAKTLHEKLAIFQALTQTNKQVFMTLITTFGLLPNKYSSELIEQTLTLDDLFRSVP